MITNQTVTGEQVRHLNTRRYTQALNPTGLKDRKNDPVSKMFTCGADNIVEQKSLSELCIMPTRSNVAKTNVNSLHYESQVENRFTDSLAHENFPVTLGPLHANHMDEDTFVTRHKICLVNGSALRDACDEGRVRRPESGHSSPSSVSRASFDQLFLSTSPTTQSQELGRVNEGSGAGWSPYSSELARLRVDGLRIEEETLLQLKRLHELERTRGPAPKWYELRTRGFHYEAHKNNDLLENGNHWQALLDYRGHVQIANRQHQEAASTT